MDHSPRYISLTIHCSEAFQEILMAEFSALGYDRFLYDEDGLQAFVPEDQFLRSEVEEIQKKYKNMIDFEFEIGTLEQKNWNEEWEKNFGPMVVDERCLIRATFHEVEQKYPLEVIINPKMSFGTGHHATTAMMVSHMLPCDHEGKKVLDVGCGTGILAILAIKLGAKEAIAIDTDAWAVKNAQENVGLNGVRSIQVLHGRLQELPVEGFFDIIYANINKNVLLEELPSYKALLKADGKLFLSGFYEEDLADLEERAKDLGLEVVGVKVEEGWCGLILVPQL